MRFRRAGIGAVALLSACATNASEPSAPSLEASRRYEANATVLQAAGKDPVICLGAVGFSLPPQCSGPPITNWDWSEAQNERSASETTWGVYHVVGTFDGERFTLTEPPGAEQPWPEARETFDTQCETPAGGWKAPDPGRATDQARSDAIERAHREPDLAGVWIDDRSERTGELQDPTTIVLNISFTGDLQRHEADLKEIWGGALCVSNADRSLEELRSIQGELTGRVAKELDVEMLSVGIDDGANVVDLKVVVVHADTQARLNERYGESVVLVRGALRPVS
jgi:hypothetical protein